MTVIVAPAALIVLSVIVVVIYFHCLKIGANADGSDILVMNPFRYILREVWIGVVGDKTYIRWWILQLRLRLIAMIYSKFLTASSSCFVGQNIAPIFQKTLLRVTLL